MKWRLGGRASLHWQYFDGDWVIYDEGSGQTLAVDAIMAAALMALESGCSAQAEIEAQVRHDVRSTLGDGLNDQLTAGLEFLSRLGLVEAVVA